MRRVSKTILSLSLVAALGLVSPSVLWAEDQQTEAKESSQADGQEEKTAENFTVTFEGGEVEITNQTTRKITKVEYKKDDAKKTDSGDKAEEENWILEITEEEGQVHTFKAVKVQNWKTPLLYDQYGILYIKYQDENSKDQEAAEDAKEKKFDQPLTMYAASDVHVRKEPTTESESLKVIKLGEEWKVSAVVPGWFKVETEEVTGYVYHAYLTEDKAAVDALVQAKKDAEAAAAAAAAEAAAQQAAQQQTWEPEEPAAPAPEEIYEVSRVQYDDCDGSGHGYYEITYSDGSVAYEEY